MCNKRRALIIYRSHRKHFFRVKSFQEWNKIPQENINPPITVKSKGLICNKRGYLINFLSCQIHTVAIFVCYCPKIIRHLLPCNLFININIKLKYSIFLFQISLLLSKVNLPHNLIVTYWEIMKLRVSPDGRRRTKQLTLVKLSKGFSFLYQCFAQLRFWKSVSDSRNLLAGATAVLLETLFQNRSCAKH